MTYELTVEAARELDRRAAEDFGIPSIVLMENAALGLCQHALEMVKGAHDPTVLICCGPGNNGGDGLALARHLHNRSISVHVVTTQADDAYTGDARTNLTILRMMGIRIEVLENGQLPETIDTPTLVVDALFGTGLTRPIEGVAGELIRWVNTTCDQSTSQMLAVDTPSGLDLQTGFPLGEVVIRADRTVTFAGLKPGMSRMEAQEFLGEVHVVPIGIPIELVVELGRPIKPKRNP